ncbi:MAG: ABC transporter substrate-binding protein [Deltaproteobacteria bacterium]|nr:ABC transporter substrate-binding protein [Deltaproteobacteria bacterium]
MRIQRIATTLVVAVLGAGLLFCGQVLALEKLRIPVASPNSSTALVQQVGIYKGWFKEIGYDAAVYSVSGGENAAVLALERGQLPFFSSDDVVPLVIRPGSNIRVVGTLMNTLPYWLVGGKHVKTYKDLPRPVKVGISSPTSGNVYVSLKLLETAGIDRKDVRLVKVGGSSARLAGVKAGKIDVGSLTFGNMLRAREANLTILGAANQFVKEYAFTQLGMNKNYIKDNPEKATAMFGTLVRGCAYINDPANREEVMHVLTKVMRNKPNLAKEMYEIEVVQSKHIPDRCQATEAGIKAFLDSAFWTKSIAADTKVPPIDQILFPEFYEKGLAWYNDKGWMKK